MLPQDRAAAGEIERITLLSEIVDIRRVWSVKFMPNRLEQDFWLNMGASYSASNDYS
jgi:hypothetical protein